MHKKTILFWLFVLVTINLQAQFGYGKVEDINALKDRTLLVELKDVSERKTKKLSKKPEKLAEYKKAVENYNNSVRRGFENWTYSKNIEFVTLERINEIIDDKKQRENYAYFKTFYTIRDISSDRGSMPEYKYSLGLTDKKKSIYILQYDSFNDFNEADAIFVTQQFDFYFKNRIKLDDKNFKRKDLLKEMKENAKMLKVKTLYLDKERMSSGLESELKSLYKYNYKLASQEEIDNAIINGTEGIVYVKFVPIMQTTQKSNTLKMSKRKYAQYFVDAETGQTIAFLTPGMSIGIVGGGNSKTSKGDIKSILKMIED
jgi:hypothetical protein